MNNGAGPGLGMLVRIRSGRWRAGCQCSRIHLGQFGLEHGYRGLRSWLNKPLRFDARLLDDPYQKLCGRRRQRNCRLIWVMFVRSGRSGIECDGSGRSGV